MKKRLFFVAIMAFAIKASAQLPMAQNFANAYIKNTRDKSGKPGVNYWQNTADYKIDIDFNPKTRLIKGSVEIAYTNNSPDTLKQLWFKLYPNLYKKGVPRQSKINERDLGDGVQISSFSVDGKQQQLTNLQVDGTNMHLNVTPVLPGAKTAIVLQYSYILNKGSHVRTGQIDDGANFVAYFFPRITVFDDIDGWNKYPYTGGEEFYNDFGNFDVSIKVPKNHVVWATGDLVNAEQVLNPSVYAKLKKAETQDQTVDVITEVDLQNNAVTAQQDFNTFKFKAQNVTDFAFATSNHYLWKASSLVVDSTSNRRTRVDAVFNPKHKDYYEVVDFARKTVDAMSYKFPAWPYPYSHETVFDGLDQMEYPMMVNDNPLNRREDVITLTDHEIFHTMFPFYMGINETKYGWMDEGWATIGEWLISSMIDTSVIDDYGIQQTAMSSATKDDSPIMTLTPNLEGIATFTNSYPKPALGYLFVKDELGDELFKTSLHQYIKNWAGKHPMPFDFFNTINTASGKNLDWFWKRWFFEGGVMDLSLKEVKKLAYGYVVAVVNKGKPLPIDITAYFENGGSQIFHQPISVWQTGNKIYQFNIPTNEKVKKFVLGSTYVPDKNPTDNTLNAH